MRRDYKDAFNQLTISDEADKKLYQIPTNYSEKRNKRKAIVRLAYAMLIIAIVSFPTITVLAANGVDVLSIFKRKFGDKTELIETNIAIPDVNVLSNTFEDIEIDITGIAGDNKLIYITMDITKKDGSIFKPKEYKFADTAFDIKILNEKLAESETVDFDFLQSTSTNFMAIPDDVIEDNKMSFAYVIDIETSINEQDYLIPGETYYLKLNNFVAEDMLAKGIWEGEFVANYVEADSIIIEEVNQIAHLPRWSTDFDYNPSTEMLISSIELSPFALRYTCEYDKSLEPDMEDRDFDYWHKLYFEMEDGSLVGIDSFETRINNLLSDTRQGGFISGGGQNDGPYKWRWIFNEPLDISKVKTINIGDLSIDLK